MQNRAKWLPLLGIILLSWGVLTGAEATLEHKVNSSQLGGKERFLLYVSTDKPIYRENETVYIRAVMLNAADNTPLNGSFDVKVEVRGPKGEVLFTGYGDGDDSSAGSTWTIASGVPGGEYKVVVTSRDLGVPKAERKFDIRAYRAPRLKSQIEYTRDGYGPGDQVQASVKIERAEGGIPDDAQITVVARLDGREIFRQSGYALDDQGICRTEFALPAEITVGEGNLAFIIEDGGVLETATKTLPVLLQNLNIDFYPEGGDLVAGLANRVYFSATRFDGKPADIAGRIFSLTDGKLDRAVGVEVKTEHEGRGAFTLNPKTSGQYVLVLDSPSGITRHFPLPASREQGAVLSAGQPVYDYDQPVTLTVATQGVAGPLSLTLHKRERLIATKEFVADSKKPSKINIDPQDAEGVLIATLWGANLQPIAERLIYRKPKYALNITVTTSNEQYVPGDTVTMEITTTDEHGKPVEAVVGLTVTDDSVLEMLETRDKAPRLPVMVYLENDVLEMADAEVYLDEANPEAPVAVDLLLATQGWRRFVLVNYQQLSEDYPDPARRIMATKVPPSAIPQLLARGAVRALDAIPPDAAFLDEDEPVDNRERNLEDDLLEQPLAAAAAAKPEAIADMLEEIAPAEQEIAPQPAMRQKRLFADEDRANGRRAEMFFEKRITLREYAHQRRPNRKVSDRIDFTETLYWHKGLRTSARDGKASVTFDLSDSVTQFRVMADGFGRNGALGSADSAIDSLEPFYIEPKMPLTISVGDRVKLPVAMINASQTAMASATLNVRGEGLNIQQGQAIALAAGERGRQMIQIEADRPGDYAITFNAAGGSYSDTVTRSLKVVAKGFPVRLHRGGLLSEQLAFTTNIELSPAIEPGSLQALAKVYPSPLASMEEALNALLREPYGCFEQTSSTNYPLVMAQQYFTSHAGVDPKKIAETKALLSRGLQRLTSFESPENGYEWFGANPGHEALTAYGLMEFVDMAKVMSVDSAMITRTRQWLLKRRDGEGGFNQNQKALDSFGRAPAPTTNAYIVWSLLESGEDPSGLAKEIAAVKQQATETQDSYLLALAANILYIAGDRKSAFEFSQRLQQTMAEDGAITQAETSITQSGGDALTIETTSLTILAWLKDDDHWAAQVETAIQWLFKRSKAGRFGSTQSTVLALKAINSYDAARAQPKKHGKVQLLIDGRPFGKPVEFNEASKGAIALPDFAAALRSGKHSVGLQMIGGSKMPFALEVSYNTTLPDNSSVMPVMLSTQLSTTRVSEGETLEMQVKVKVADEAAPTPIAIIGIPGGLEVNHNQLKELVAADKISAYEVIASELVLYWRGLNANETRSLPIVLIAAIPGHFTGSASRAYLYYTDEHKMWVKGQEVEVLPRR